MEVDGMGKAGGKEEKETERETIDLKGSQQAPLFFVKDKNYPEVLVSYSDVSKKPSVGEY